MTYIADTQPLEDAGATISEKKNSVSMLSSKESFSSVGTYLHHRTHFHSQPSVQSSRGSRRRPFPCLSDPTQPQIP